MDQCLVSGSNLDFTTYWADRTIEEAIHRGHKLRLEKAQPLPPREFDVVNIDFIKTPYGCGSRRKRSPKRYSKRNRSRSPCYCKISRPGSPSKPKKQNKTAYSKAQCGMRIAELAMPTKRHCLETWKNMSETLPDYMIERLRRLVMDQKPVVQISDAINCFKRKCKRLKKPDKYVDKCDKILERRKKVNDLLSQCDVTAISALLGHKIAKKLIIPMNIVLNPELQKIACVIWCDIENIMKKSKIKRKDRHTKKYQLFEEDIVKKITIWIASILEDSNEKMLEDELREFEEEVGPALDAVDDIVDTAMDICIPEPDFVDELPAWESEEPGIDTEESGADTKGSGIDDEEPGMDAEESGIDEVIIEEQSSSCDGSEEQYIEITIERFIQNEVDTLINDIKDSNVTIEYPDTDDGSGWKASVETEKPHTDYAQIDEGIVTEQRDDDEAINIEIKNSKHSQGEIVYEVKPPSGRFSDQNENVGVQEESDHIFIENEDNVGIKESKSVEDMALSPSEVEPSKEVENDRVLPIENQENDTATAQPPNDVVDTDTTMPPSETAEDDTELLPIETTDIEVALPTLDITENDTALQKIGNTEATDNYENDDEYLESEDGLQDATEESLENTDDVTETFADAAEDKPVSITEESFSDLDRKVTFDANVNNEATNEKSEADINWKASIEHIDFAEPNENLLSDADETWPGDVSTPVIRPSQSVSKSITSLGKIKEDEEQLSVKHEDSSEETKKSVETKTQDDGQTIQIEIGDFQLEIEHQTKPVEDKTPKQKPDTTKSKKSKVDTASKDSKDQKNKKEQRISDSKKVKPQTKTPSSISRYKRPSQASKTETTPAAVKPSSKPKKKKDKDILIQDIEVTKTPKRKVTENTKTGPTVIDLDTKSNDDKFSTETVKRKPDYRVNFQTAPIWINRNFNEPSCTCFQLPSKMKGKPKINENLLRRWCQDLEKGYENLKMWNEWIDNTTRTVTILQQEIGKSCSDRCSNKEWIKLKRNIDKDAQLWKKLNLHTQERLRCYKKLYQKRSETTSSSNYIICCSNSKL